MFSEEEKAKFKAQDALIRESRKTGVFVSVPDDAGRLIAREAAITLQAKVLCLIAGIEPIDSLDGSSNWWAFNADAEKIVDDIRARFPAFSKNAP